METFHYSLKRYQGRSSRLQCPHCGRNHCFTPYVDALGNIVDPACGKCDHESSCGYHLPPREFFAKHPDRNQGTPKDMPIIPKRQVQTAFIPIVLLHLSHSRGSTFWQWIESLGLPEDNVAKVFNEYHIGATKARQVIFWQIDTQGNVHDGKIMAYEPDGHRSHGQFPDFVSSRLRKEQKVPRGYYTDKVFFGLHLVKDCDPRAVIIVESEKTALLGAIIQPQHLWLATGGCAYLNKERIESLLGHRLVLIPDSGMYDKWKQVMEFTEGLDYSISQAMEQYPPNTDIADVLLGEARQLTEAEKLVNRMAADSPAFALLRDKLDLRPVE